MNYVDLQLTIYTLIQSFAQSPVFPPHNTAHYRTAPYFDYTRLPSQLCVPACGTMKSLATKTVSTLEAVIFQGARRGPMLQNSDSNFSTVTIKHPR